MIDSILTSPITISQILICLGAALAAGILMALVFMFRSRSSASFSVTMAVLPMTMAMVVMVINGNLGVAVAVAGGFALVRFRSIAGTGREISAVFIDMTLGVILGMGYVGIAAVFFVITTLLVLVLTAINFGAHTHDKLLKITIPEDYDYTSLFDDIFGKYGVKSAIEKIKTTNMGSLIDVTYRITMPTATVTKEMLDELRARNANLSIVISNADMAKETL